MSSNNNVSKKDMTKVTEEDLLPAEVLPMLSQREVTKENLESTMDQVRDQDEHSESPHAVSEDIIYYTDKAASEREACTGNNLTRVSCTGPEMPAQFELTSAPHNEERLDQLKTPSVHPVVSLIFMSLILTEMESNSLVQGLPETQETDPDTEKPQSSSLKKEDSSEKKSTEDEVFSGESPPELNNSVQSETITSVPSPREEEDTEDEQVLLVADNLNAINDKVSHSGDCEFVEISEAKAEPDAFLREHHDSKEVELSSEKEVIDGGDTTGLEDSSEVGPQDQHKTQLGSPAGSAISLPEIQTEVEHGFKEQTQEARPNIDQSFSQIVLEGPPVACFLIRIMVRSLIKKTGFCDYQDHMQVVALLEDKLKDVLNVDPEVHITLKDMRKMGKAAARDLLYHPRNEGMQLDPHNARFQNMIVIHLNDQLYHFKHFTLKKRQQKKGLAWLTSAIVGLFRARP